MRARGLRRRLGFTLIEMMVAVLVGATGVVLAAKVAQVILRQSSKGRQSTDFHARSRLVTRQLRADLRAAGVGSTGAVGVDGTVAPWSTMNVPSIGGFASIPVVMGINGIGGGVTVGGVNVLQGSDAIQIVVTDPKSTVRTIAYNPSGQNIIGLDAPPPPCSSGFVYVVDHTAPTGQGRTQLLSITGFLPQGITTTGRLQFTLGSGSDVMCARVSTYWVDDAGWLHRSDLSGPAAALASLGGSVWADATNVATDGLSPGVLDLQIAYAVSGEVYRASGLAPPIGQSWRMWTFEGVAGNADALMVSPDRWFEVRSVRANFLMRTMRRIEAYGVTRDIVRREDGSGLGPITLTRALAAEWAVAAEDLTNQRFFDIGMPTGTAAEPY